MREISYICYNFLKNLLDLKDSANILTIFFTQVLPSIMKDVFLPQRLKKETQGLYETSRFWIELMEVKKPQ